MDSGIGPKSTQPPASGLAVMAFHSMGEHRLLLIRLQREILFLSGAGGRPPCPGALHDGRLIHPLIKNMAEV